MHVNNDRLTAVLTGVRNRVAECEKVCNVCKEKECNAVDGEWTSAAVAGAI